MLRLSPSVKSFHAQVFTFPAGGNPDARCIKADPHVHCVNIIVRVQLDYRAISCASDVRVALIQHNDVASFH